MKLLRKGCLVLLGIGAIVLLAGVVALWRYDNKYEFLRAAPRIEHGDILNLHPSIRVIVDPAKVSDIVKNMIEEQVEREIPDWLLTRILPYEISAIFNSDLDKGIVKIRLMINERRFGPLIAAQFNAIDIPGRFPELQWDAKGMIPYRRGALTLNASLPMEEVARVDAWYTWNQTGLRRPLALDGTHLFEVMGDNREGGAYLVAAALMEAYDYELDETEQDVSFTSFQFVTKMHLTGDMVGSDALKLRLTMEVIEEFKDRVAVVNLKAFLDRGLESLTEDFAKYHDIEFTGESRKDNNVMVFEYTLEDLSKTIGLYIRGELFVE